MTTVQTAFADDEDVRKGAIVRIPAAGKRRPYCLKIVSREPVSQATGAIAVVGEVLGVNGTTTRARRLVRSAVLVPGRYEFFRTVPRFTAKLATLAMERGDGTVALITRWGVVNDETGEPLPGGGTGPVVIEHLVGSEVYRWTLVGTWEGKPAPWLAKEYSEQTEAERRGLDPIAQCMNRVRNERGILRVGENLVYDLSSWNHWSAQELREVEPGVMAWRDTYVCKHCGRDLTWIRQSPWFRAADGTTECDAEVYVP
jgi:hypothetical protein